MENEETRDAIKIIMIVCSIIAYIVIFVVVGISTWININFNIYNKQYIIFDTLSGIITGFLWVHAVRLAIRGIFYIYDVKNHVEVKRRNIILRFFTMHKVLFLINGPLLLLKSFFENKIYWFAEDPYYIAIRIRKGFDYRIWEIVKFEIALIVLNFLLVHYVSEYYRINKFKDNYAEVSDQNNEGIALQAKEQSEVVKDMTLEELEGAYRINSENDIDRKEVIKTLKSYLRNLVDKNIIFCEDDEINMWYYNYTGRTRCFMYYYLKEEGELIRYDCELDYVAGVCYKFIVNDEIIHYDERKYLLELRKCLDEQGIDVDKFEILKNIGTNEEIKQIGNIEKHRFMDLSDTNDELLSKYAKDYKSRIKRFDKRRGDILFAEDSEITTKVYTDPRIVEITGVYYVLEEGVKKSNSFLVKYIRGEFYYLAINDMCKYDDWFIYKANIKNTGRNRKSKQIGRIEECRFMDISDPNDKVSAKYAKAYRSIIKRFEKRTDILFAEDSEITCKVNTDSGVVEINGIYYVIEKEIKICKYFVMKYIRGEFYYLAINGKCQYNVWFKYKANSKNTGRNKKSKQICSIEKCRFMDISDPNDKVSAKYVQDYKSVIKKFEKRRANILFAEDSEITGKVNTDSGIVEINGVYYVIKKGVKKGKYFEMRFIRGEFYYLQINNKIKYNNWFRYKFKMR